jgi:hypothetical protein
MLSDAKSGISQYSSVMVGSALGNKVSMKTNTARDAKTSEIVRGL